MSNPTIKYHINLPVDPSKYSDKDATLLVNDALTKLFSIASTTAWVATLGAQGVRVSVIFNMPFPKNAEIIVELVNHQLSLDAWTLEGRVTAWEHP